MTALLLQVADWLKRNGPWLALILPSVIVGLTQAPKDGNVADWMKWFLQLFSIVTHKDQPGTFKPPFKTSGTPGKKPPSSTAAILLMVSLGGLVGTGLGGCATLSAIFGIGGEIIISCGGSTAVDDASVLIPVIRAILTGKGDKKKLLDALESYGRDAVACALNAVIQELQGQGTGASPPSPESVGRYTVQHTSPQQAAQDGRDYLKQKGWKIQ